MDERLRIVLAEGAGTAILVMGGCGTAVLAAGAVGEFGGVGVFGVATAFGLSLLILAYAIGHISGCHVNPAVTLGMLLGGKVDPKLAPYYWGAQLLGGLGGGGLLRLIFWSSKNVIVPEGFATNGWGSNSPLGFNLTAVAITEVVMTAIFVFVVISTTHPRFPAGFGGLAAGGTLWLVHLISIPVSNTSVNPARSLAVAPWAPDHTGLKQVWAFFVFPLIGAAVGAVVYRILNADPAVDASVPDIEGTIPKADDGGSTTVIVVEEDGA
jgi:aquaporin Z